MSSLRSFRRLLVLGCLLLPSTLWGATLTLSPSAAGPNVTGTRQTMIAVFKDTNGSPITSVVATFTVTGANTQTGSATTDGTGTAAFSYTGALAGTDMITASATFNGAASTSNKATVSWVTPTRNITSTTITAKFFTSDNSGIFKTTPAQPPAFTQTFPTINFNPPSGTVPGNTSGVTENTRPMVDITTDLNGNFTGAITAQGNGFAAGVGLLNQLSAVFTGTFTVSTAGNVTFNFFSDDGFIFGIGNGATRVSGSNVNPPTSGLTPFQSYPVMGALNGPNSPTAVTVVVNFPAPGTYPYEIDYTECCGGQLAITLTTSNGTTNVPVPPSGSLTMTPATVASKAVGGSDTFTVLATDASGAVIANLLVTLTITGVNAQTLSATTDTTGKATFTYSGTHGTGTDYLQASATITGMPALSNVATATWNNGKNQAPVVSAGPNQTINLPAAAVLSGTVTDDGLPAGATVTSTWSKMNGPGTVTFSNPNYPNSLATFSAAGSYVLKLSASDTKLTGTSQVTITVTANPGVGLSSSTLTFANQAVGTTSAVQTVTLTNTGTVALTITSIAASGDFSQTNTCGTSVAASATCTISVTFKPTAAGTRTGAITIIDNAGGSPQTISLTGTGTSGPVVSLSPTSLTFASQVLNTTSPVQTATLTNTGSAALSITSIAASGDFSQTNNCGTSVAAAGSCTISVTFKPTVAGARSGSITITDNATGSPQTVMLNGSGATAPAVSLSPTSLTFASQPVNTTSAVQTVTLTNSGSAALSITSIAASGDFSESNSCGTSVASAGSCTISVRFTPTAGGTRTGSFSITDNATNSPQTVALSGTGTTAPAVSLAPTSLSFGNQLAGTTSAAQTVTLTNSGSASLSITSITASGDFSQSNNCGTSVAVGSSCTITVTFTPTAGGSRTGNISITDNATNSPQTVALTGTATTAPAVTLAPTSLSFGNQLLGTTSAAQTVTLTNSGSAALTITSIAASGDFSQSNNCGTSVAAAGSCTISVTFAPTVGGTRTGNISITDNATNSPQTVSLTGTAPVVTVSPSSVTLFSGQSQQFNAIVGLPNTTVTWTISPSSSGSISSSGFYTAPACVTAQQTVMVTATSVADPTQTASATLTLLPGSSFNYRRPVVIDHTKVSNTDQSNFPVVVNITDATLASSANGGHVANANGFDLVFTSDSTCNTKLNYEIDTWNPVTGQLVAWVQAPLLSHTADTVLYLCYGNASITTDQSNKTAVWDSNYKGVWHLSGGSTLSAADSTSNANNGTVSGATPASGLIGGAGAFNGSNSYIALPSRAFSFYPTSGSTTALTYTFETWFKTGFNGGILGQTNGALPGGGLSGWVPALYLDSNSALRASFFWHGGTSPLTSAQPYKDNAWHYAVDTYNNGVETLYIDGAVAASQNVTQFSYGSNYGYFLGSAPELNWPNGTATWAYLNGLIDEVRVSNSARSANWIATQYNNQNSPGTFAVLEPENAAFAISPPSTALYASGTQQFTATPVASCGSSAVNWSVNPANAGSISASGLYTAPISIPTQQIVAIIATSQADSTQTGAATVTLYPPVAISITPTMATLAVGQMQQFAATVANSLNTAVTWIISPSTGTITTSGLYTAPASLTTQQTVTVTATSVFDPTKSASAAVTVEPFAGSPIFFPPSGTYAQPEAITITSASPTALIRYTTDGSAPTETAGTPYTGPITVSSNTTIKAIAYGAGLADSPVISATYSFASATGFAQFLFTDTTAEGSWQGVYGKDGYNVIGGTSAYPSYVTVTPSGQNTFIWASSTTDVRALESSATGNARVAGTWFAGGSFTVDFNFSDGNAHQLGLYLLDWDSTSRAETITVLDAATNAILDIRNAASFSSGQYWVWLLRGHVTFKFTQSAGANAVVSGLFFDPTGVTISPRASMLSPNQTQQFNARVTNSSNTAVTWTTSLGTVSSSGLYTAPASVVTEQTASVTATSVADPTKSDTAVVTLLPGSTGGGFDQVVPILSESLCRHPHVAPTISAGPDQYVTLGSCTGSQCSGVVTMSGAVLNFNLEPGFSLSYNWTQLTGPAPVQFASPSALSTNVTVTTAGVYTLQLTVDDGAAATTAVAHVYVNPANFASNGYLSLSPAISGPNAVGTSTSLQARFILFPFGSPSNAPYQVQVTGANPQTTTVTSDANGVAVFTYTGVNPGVDTITASFNTQTLNGTYNSNTTTVTWVSAPANLNASPVTGRFFPADGSGVFNTPPGTQPAFTQTFPVLDFNPAAGSISGNTSGVTSSTRPFTDIVTDRNGNYLGPIVAQGSGYQAGAGPLYNFSGVFTGTVNVPAAGQVVFTVTSDDGFIFGMGNGATRVSGPLVNTPATTPFQNYPVMGGVNQRNAASSNVITVNFPSAGAYPYEIDYAKGGDQNLTLTLQANGASIPAAALLKLSPSQVPAIQAGQIEQFTLNATNSDGIVIPNLPVTFIVTGENAQTRLDLTDGTGQAGFAYAGSSLLTGLDTVQAAAHINGADVYSNAVPVVWNSGTNQAPVVNAGPDQVITLPAAAYLNGAVSDDGLPNNTLTVTWSMLSGPAPVTFDNANQAVTAARFSTAGTYVLQLSASDGALTSNSTLTVVVNPITSWTTGWIANPIDKSTVSGQVPITLVAGITLTGGTLTYYPASNVNAVTTLNPSTTGTGQIGIFDATLLPDGAYWIELKATNSNGVTQDNLVLVTVAGDYKPGRVLATVTDLTVPAPGMPIQIQRTYDSLTRNTSSDFGFGWTLGVNVQMDVNPLGDVSFTLNGRRRVFYFTPQPNAVFTSFSQPQYTPEPGMFGSLVDTGDNCFGVLIHIGNLFECALNNAGQVYQASGFRYTDPYGRMYTMSVSGTLQSVKDLNGNTLTITASGISSSNGLSVPFVRDAEGRITSITDPLGNVYTYSYNANGELASLTLPTITGISAQPKTYTYNPGHYLAQETNARGNTAGSTTYFPDGRLQSVTDAVGNTKSYSYDVTNQTTTATNPDGGTEISQYDSFGMLLKFTDALGRNTSYIYDSQHNRTTETNPLNKITVYTYDANGFLTSVKDPLGNINSVAYNQTGRPTSVTNPLNWTQNVTYDQLGNVNTISDNLSQIAQYTWSSQGLPLTFKNARGDTSSYQYDAFGNRISTTDVLGRTTSSAFDANGRMISQTDPRGNTTTYAYDALGQRTSVTLPAPGSPASGNGGSMVHTLSATTAASGTGGTGTTTFTYDANGNKTSETDPLGHTTQYAYDPANRLIQITYPNGTTRSFTYDFRDKMLTDTDEAGHVTQYVYDQAGELTSVTRASGTPNASAVSFTYDLASRRLTQSDPLNHQTTFGYDDAGNLTTITDARNHITTITYDATGNRETVLDPLGHLTQYIYDDRRNLVKTTYPDGTSATSTFDFLGAPVSITDQDQHTTTYTYDAASQLLAVTDALGGTARFTYDSSGNKLTQTDANSHTTSYTYDNLNRRITRTLPTGVTEGYSYDLVDNRVARSDFNGKTTTYTYDELNRLTGRIPDASLTNQTPVTFTYTPTGQRQTMSDAGGLQTWTYDNQDRIVSKSTPRGTLTYTWNAAGNLTSTTSSNVNGINLSYTYDEVNQLATVTDLRLANGVTTYNYDNNGNIASVTYPNGVVQTLQYDVNDRIANVGLANGSASIAGFAQTYGKTGQKLSITEQSGRSVVYGFDNVFKLLSENIATDPVPRNNGALTYNYDLVGNRLSQNSTLAALKASSSTFDAADRLTADSYDNNGNTTASNGNSYGYDFENHLTSVNGGSVTMVYDGDGNRVSKTVDGLTTTYLVDDLNPTGYFQVAEELVAGAVERRYTLGTVRISQSQLINGAWSTGFYGYDGNGSTREFTDQSGSVTDTYAYDAFGNVIAQTGSTANEYLYRNEQYDLDLELYNLRARWYKPQTGRFLTADTWKGDDDDPASLHRYMYSDADPVNRFDPSGHDSIDESAAGTQIASAPAQTSLAPNVADAGVTGGRVRKLAKIAWDTICCIDKAWSEVGLALDFIAAVTGEPQVSLPTDRALALITEACKLDCNAKKKGKDNVIYRKKVGDGDYFGRGSGDGNPADIFGRRNRNHHVPGDGNVIFGPLPYPVARGIEQILIHCAGGIGAKGLINRINGVGPRGMNRNGYIKCAMQFLQQLPDGQVGDDGCPVLSAL